jgi:hypothetical protein
MVNYRKSGVCKADNFPVFLNNENPNSNKKKV